MGYREAQRAGTGPFPEDDVEVEVLHRRVEHLLDDPRQPMDLVDEQDAARFEVREDGREVAGPLHRRTAGRAERHAKLVGDDDRERRLPHPRRPVQRDVLERLVPALRRVDEDAEVRLDLLLIDVLVVGEALRAERGLERALLFTRDRRDRPLRRAHRAVSRAR